jgi:hypothetical protein
MVTIAPYLPPKPTSVQSGLAVEPSSTAVSDYAPVSGQSVVQPNSTPTQADTAVSIPVATGQALSDSIDSVLDNDANEDVPTRIINLNIGGIIAPPNADCMLRIFINNSKPDKNVPTDDLTHLRYVSWVCCGDHNIVPSFNFDVTTLFKKLRGNGKAKGHFKKFSVQVLAIPFRDGAVAPAIVPGYVQLSVLSR